VNSLGLVFCTIDSKPTACVKLMSSSSSSSSSSSGQEFRLGNDPFRPQICIRVGVRLTLLDVNCASMNTKNMSETLFNDDTLLLYLTGLHVKMARFSCRWERKGWSDIC